MSLTYSECKKIALDKNPNVNACYEYDNAYRFVEKSDEEIDGDFEVVVLKENGRAMGWVQFLDFCRPTTDLNEIKF